MGSLESLSEGTPKAGSDLVSPSQSIFTNIRYYQAIHVIASHFLAYKVHKQSVLSITWKVQVSHSDTFLLTDCYLHW
jgi:hypothetical protein